MPGGKGGARHFAKPQVDEGLLLKVLSSHADIVASMGAYEAVSKSQAANPQGLIRVLPLVNGLLRLEPTCEVHPGNLRSALLELLMQEPGLNQTKFNGKTWCNMRVQRLGVVLSHFRRLRLSDDLRACASKLNSCDFLRLSPIVESIVVKAETNKERPPQKRLRAAVEEDLEEGRPKRRLTGKVSLDSDGWPNCFNEKTAEEGALVKGSGDEEGALVKGSGDEALASAEEGSPPALPTPREPQFLRRRPAAKGKAGILEKRKPWVVLKVTYAKKPERAYIQGITSPGEKKRLIVEVSRFRSELYREHIQTLHKLFKDEHLTKAEAMQMKEELCNK
ncbi:hypothetical protein AK812_SmicGene11556 [Symbiodinium microadriaticum]|uniref:Uncharacterized protein n=1 Tax=Symbiodinium microadriaticum TaxID=2951 RepID=A0A1Q9ECW8_SYMMI|nr:hypothetical protein AK812_SmicGene11556 [Symbiodinium microadriaticum]